MDASGGPEIRIQLGVVLVKMWPGRTLDVCVGRNFEYS